MYYCRWRGAKLRLRGRDAGAVCGELVSDDEAGPRAEPFRYELQTWRLWLGQNSATPLQLDELGVVVGNEEGSGTA